MTVTERLKKFDADFAKLRHNRKKVPISELQTRYANKYNALVETVLEGAEYFAAAFLNALAFPVNRDDHEGFEKLYKSLEAIELEERQPGGLISRFRVALIDNLDRDEFEDLVGKFYERQLNDAFDPYWQSHCHVQADGRIYNDIFNKFWSHDKQGWLNSDNSGWDGRFPPNLNQEDDKNP